MGLALFEASPHAVRRVATVCKIDFVDPDVPVLSVYGLPY